MHAIKDASANGIAVSSTESEPKEQPTWHLQQQLELYERTLQAIATLTEDTASDLAAKALGKRLWQPLVGRRSLA